MTAKKTTKVRGEELTEEIEWLRSFGWGEERIADRLGIRLDSLQQRDRRREQRLAAREGKQ